MGEPDGDLQDNLSGLKYLVSLLQPAGMIYKLLNKQDQILFGKV